MMQIPTSAAMAELHDSVWAITPRRLSHMDHVLRSAGPTLAAPPRPTSQSVGLRDGKGVVAVERISGIITPRPSWLSMIFGGTPLSELMPRLRQLAADKSVAAVVLDINSPGGMVAGLREAADELRDLRRRKPIVSLGNSLVASAAYFLAASTSKLVGISASEWGSIGVLTAHVSFAGALEKAGIKTTYISSTPEKVEFASELELSKSAKAHEQGIVDSLYGHFIRSVSVGRGVPSVTVRDEWGSGRLWLAAESLSKGLIDGVVNGLPEAAMEALRQTPVRREAARRRREIESLTT